VVEGSGTAAAGQTENALRRFVQGARQRIAHLGPGAAAAVQDVVDGGVRQAGIGPQKEETAASLAAVSAKYG
jgi:hypothetical protein